MDYDMKLLPRNVLTGAVVNGVESDTRGSLESGITLSWKDLSVTRTRKTSNAFWGRSKYEKVHILRNVNGMIQSGNLTAIMGARKVLWTTAWWAAKYGGTYVYVDDTEKGHTTSIRQHGSGKTSLLAAASARLRGGARGTLLLNGHRVDAPTLARLSGFLPQHDLAIEELTVNEHMEFMARLALDARTSRGARARRVQQLLLELGVARCVGTRLSALSGGERKRVALAVQLLNDPPLLFCDEPTTGLDSWSAAAVLEKLRELAERGMAVLCSVHQPASGLFDRFHQLLLLAAGRVAYHGTVVEAPDFFSRLNYSCPIGYNESEYYVSLLSTVRGQEVESSIRIQQICDAYDKSKIGIQLRNNLYYLETGKLNVLEADITSIFDTGQDKTFEPFSRYLTLRKVGFITQFIWLMWRAILSGKRNNSVWLAEFIMYMAISVMIILPYLNVADDFDQSDIQNIQGLMYLVIAETVFMFIYSVSNTFPEEIPIILRDMANGLYSPGPYYAAKALLMIPRSVVEPTLYASLIFVAVGLRGGVAGWALFVFFVVLSANVANSYGAALSASFESIATASLLAVPIDLVGTTFSGIFINLASLPLSIQWMQYVSIFRYGIEAISILQWTDITTINCVDIPGMPCIRTGEEVLERFGFDTDVTYDVIGLGTIYVVCHLLGYVMICRRSKQQVAY